MRSLPSKVWLASCLKILGPSSLSSIAEPLVRRFGISKAEASSFLKQMVKERVLVSGAGGKFRYNPEKTVVTQLPTSTMTSRDHSGHRLLQLRVMDWAESKDGVPILPEDFTEEAKSDYNGHADLDF